MDIYQNGWQNVIWILKMSEDVNLKPIISDKPYPVPIEMRPLWRICLIVISIAVVSDEKKYLDIKKVNILVWMLIRRARWNEYERFLLDQSKDIPLVSVDTATYKAVEYSLAKEFVTLDSGRLHMTTKSDELFSLLKQNELMLDEIEFLRTNGKKLTDLKVKELTGGLL